jgi:hypothetical protein
MKPTKKLTPTSHQQTEATAEVIKLGIDIHKTKYVVIRQIDNQAAQSPQSFSPDEFIVWVQRQRLLAKRVVSCYEAGCFGFVLHRKLAEVAVDNFVVRPRNWDEYGSSVKTRVKMGSVHVFLIFKLRPQAAIGLSQLPLAANLAAQ